MVSFQILWTLPPNFVDTFSYITAATQPQDEGLHHAPRERRQDARQAAEAAHADCGEGWGIHETVFHQNNSGSVHINTNNTAADHSNNNHNQANINLTADDNSDHNNNHNTSSACSVISPVSYFGPPPLNWITNNWIWGEQNFIPKTKSCFFIS